MLNSGYFIMVMLCCLLFGGVVAQDSKNLTNEERIELAAENPLEEYLSRVSVKITAEKTEFIPFESIVIHYDLTSKAGFILRIPFHGVMDEEFLIVNDSGQKMGPTIHTNCIVWDSILPYGSLSGSTDISKKYDLTIPGTYACQLTPRGWESNEIEIEVVEPTGDMRKVWLLFREGQALDNGCGSPQGEKCKKAYSLYLQIVDDYSQTYYAPRALREAFFIDWLADRQTVEDKSKEYIEAGIEGKLLDICLESIMATSLMLDTRADGEVYFQSIIDNNQGTYKGERALYWLEDLRNRPPKK